MKMKCPSCSSILETSFKMAGKRIQCPTCFKTILVPTVQVIKDPDSPGLPETDLDFPLKPESLPQDDESSSTDVLGFASLVFGILGALCLPLGCILNFLFIPAIGLGSIGLVLGILSKGKMRLPDVGLNTLVLMPAIGLSTIYLMGYLGHETEQERYLQEEAADLQRRRQEKELAAQELARKKEAQDLEAKQAKAEEEKRQKELEFKRQQELLEKEKLERERQAQLEKERKAQVEREQKEIAQKMEEDRLKREAIAKKEKEEKERELARKNAEKNRRADLEAKGLPYYPEPFTFYQGFNATQWHKKGLGKNSEEAIDALINLKEEGTPFLYDLLEKTNMDKLKLDKIVDGLDLSQVHKNDIKRFFPLLERGKIYNGTRLKIVRYLSSLPGAKLHVNQIEELIKDITNPAGLRSDTVYQQSAEAKRLIEEFRK